MSLFDPTTDQNSTATSSTGDNQGSFLEKLVSSKGDQWKDPEVIAKGKLEADAFIEEQKRKIAELEAKLQQETYSKTLLDRLQTQVAAPPQQSANHNAGEPPKENTTLDVGSIEDLVRKSLQKAEEEKKAESNLQKVERVLTEKFGDKAQSVISSKAKEMGVSMEFLGSIAKQSADAFLRLVSTETTTEAGHTVRNNVNTGGNFSSSSERNYHFYEELRKSDSKKYWAKETQDQLLKDRLSLGDRWKR